MSCWLRRAIAMTLALGLSSGVAHAGLSDLIVNSARTAAHGVRDGALTIGRTTRAFVLGGAYAAEDAWHHNVDLTRTHARQNADRVRASAGVAPEDEPAVPHPPTDPEREDVPLDPAVPAD